MDMQQIEMIGLQGLQARFHDGEALLRIAVAQLGGNKDAVAAALQRLADALFGEVLLTIVVRAIDVADAQIQTLVNGLDRPVLFFVLQVAAARAHRQNRDVHAGLSEDTGGHVGTAGGRK